MIINFKYKNDYYCHMNVVNYNIILWASPVVVYYRRPLVSPTASRGLAAAIVVPPSFSVSSVDVFLRHSLLLRSTER